MLWLTFNRMRTKLLLLTSTFWSKLIFQKKKSLIFKVQKQPLDNRSLGKKTDIKHHTITCRSELDAGAVTAESAVEFNSTSKFEGLNAYCLLYSAETSARFFVISRFPLTAGCTHDGQFRAANSKNPWRLMSGGMLTAYPEFSILKM
jgi:hypothetical protein